LPDCQNSRFSDQEFTAFGAIDPGIVNNDFYIHPEGIVATFRANLLFFSGLVVFKRRFPDHFSLLLK
jgi:hypothetical protein